MQDVTVLALTDHDTLSGLEAAHRRAAIEGLDLINGIEFSCLWAGCNIHVLGLNIDVACGAIVNVVAEQERRRLTRAEVIATKLAGLGIDGSLEGARAAANGTIIGRPHFANYLVESGHCSSVQQAFKKYLGSGKPGDVKQMWPEFEEILPAIAEAGGVAVLAHPDKYKMTRTKLCEMLVDFKELGGSAIEVVSGAQSVNLTRDLASLANKFGLLASCGSDFHTPDNPWQELGKYSQLPDNVIPVWTAWE